MAHRLKPSDSYELGNFAYLRLGSTPSSIASSASDLSSVRTQTDDVSLLATAEISDTDERSPQRSSPRVMKASLARKLMVFTTVYDEMTKVREI